MTAGTTRRARIVIEGDVREVSGRCGVLRVDLPRDDTGLIPTVMVNPSWAGVTVEDLAPSYNWQDGDATLALLDNKIWVREGGQWMAPGVRKLLTDGDVSRVVNATAHWSVLRYQSGDE